jgi:hypothetical protein
MAMGWTRSGQASIKALVGVSYLHGRQLLYLHGVGNRSPHASVVVLAPWVRAVRPGPMLQSKPDLLCEAETCRGDPSSGELVGDAANWPKTGCLASVGLDQGPQSSLS